MVETPGLGEELRYRNVSIHSQGKTEHGTLYLLKHHLRFSYHPSARKSDIATAHSRSTSGAHNPMENDASTRKDVTQPSEQPQDSGNDASNTYVKSQSRPEPAKVRPKEIWLPHPMISSCVLRPSHAASITARPSMLDDPAVATQSGDDLFPPTFGTSGYERPSTDSARLAPFSTPPRPSSPTHSIEPIAAPESARQPVIRIRRKDFQMLALHFNSGHSDMSSDEAARQAFHVLRQRCCTGNFQRLHAFDYQPPKDEARAAVEYDVRREFARMGVSPKAADGPGTAWRFTDINHDYSYSKTYPNVLCVPKAVSDNLLKYGGTFRSKSRIPCLSYLHSNGGSITRASQPLRGVQGKRNPQDERLVSAIFSSHTPPMHSPEDSPPQETSLTLPPSATLDSSTSEPANLNGDNLSLRASRSEAALDEKMVDKPPAPRIYGSTRQNVIVDARPFANVFANQLGGGGIEDVAHYTANGHVPVEKVFLDIANIHVMRKSLEKIIESFGSADYIGMQPNQDTLRKSGWLGHISGLLEGSEMVARVVGLGGSHVLVHCSDGWDRTSQVVALAQVMLDPHYRTLAGFISLVQKDFLSFGHKFRDRDGIEGSEAWFKIENERVVPSRTRENASSDSGGLNAMGQKAFSGARRWIEKNRGNLFNSQSNSRNSSAPDPDSRPSSPPPNPLVHSTPSSDSKDDKDTKMKIDEVSPVFHQFLDTVFQLLHQQSNAFEFNERFLKRLFYHAYSCQYGEFLFNNERERSQHKLPSVWGYFLSKKQEFTNPDYVAKVDDPLLFPRRHGVEREMEVRWWADLFGRKDEEMNLPRPLAPANAVPNTASLRPSSSFEESAGDDGSKSGIVTPEGAIKETRSTPSLAAMRDSLTNSFSSMKFKSPEGKKDPAPGPHMNPAETVTAADPAIPGQADQRPQDILPEAPPRASETSNFDQMDMDEGDPLGVSSSAPKQVGSGGLDFAAFASQNAFSER